MLANLIALATLLWEILSDYGLIPTKEIFMGSFAQLMVILAILVGVPTVVFFGLNKLTGNRAAERLAERAAEKAADRAAEKVIKAMQSDQVNE